MLSWSAVSKNYRSVIIGASGRRSGAHAAAYHHQSRAKLVAVSARNSGPRDEMASKFGVGRCYDDYREMLGIEKPDIVHISTPPYARLSVLKEVAATGSQAAILEKPVAIDSSDCRELSTFSQSTQLKVAINHQLHFHAPIRRLQELVLQGEIGDVRFIEGSSRMNAAYQGTHILQLIDAFSGKKKPKSLVAQASGVRGLEVNRKGHLAPDDLVVFLDFHDELRAVFRCGIGAPEMTINPISVRGKDPYHKRIAVYGEKGHVIWTMYSWETLFGTRLERGTHDYWEEDEPAETDLVGSVIDWIEGSITVHPLELRAATEQFSILLSAYHSAISRQTVFLPQEKQLPVINRLRQVLSLTDSVIESK